MVIDGLSAPSPRVVYAAVYAAAELCTYLGVRTRASHQLQGFWTKTTQLTKSCIIQGVVQERFGEELLSAFYRIVNTPYAPGRLVAYSCAALVNFTSDIEVVPQSFIQHGPSIIERLLHLISNENSRDDVRLKAMSAAGQSASVLAGEGALSPHMLGDVFEVFWPFLTGNVENDVKARAIDCATLVGE